MTECVFCKIVSGDIPSNKVHEDSALLAFEDVNPVAPTHVLIVPKEHVPTLNDASEEHRGLLGAMVLRAAEIAKERNLSEGGYRLVLNCMRGAGQSVFHIHLHLMGGRLFSWPPG